MVKTNIGADRISGLPESVLHHILSFLDMREVLQTSFISTRWRYLWTSVPDLNFGYSPLNKQKPFPYVKAAGGDECMGFVNNVFFLRDKSSPIRKLHITNDYCSDVFLLNIWLLMAVKLHVKEVCIEFHRPEGERLLDNPQHVEEIEVFKLFSPLKLPKSICSAPKLKTLELASVKLPKGDSNGKFILQCPVLECLVLNHCNLGHLEFFVISASQLKTLVVENIVCCGAVTISTPNLISFEIKTFIGTRYSVENLSSLVSARVGSEYNDFGKIIAALYNVTSLDLSSSYQVETLQGCEMINPFPNLRSLNLNGLSTCSTRQVTEILKHSPSLENINITMDMHEGDDWEAESSFQHMFNHLKCVKVKNVQGSTNELKFLEFILTNAVALEKVVVTFPEPASVHEKIEPQELIKKLQSLPKASPRVSILVCK